MSEQLRCPICGKPTSNYYGKYREDGLCREHKDMLKDGLIYQCADCGKWNEKDIICDCKKVKEEAKTEQKNNVIIINQDNKSKCITCGKKIDGLLFCTECYKKYKNKELLFKITNCSSVELLDEDYEGKFTCKDGHIVKSKSERDIDNFLFENDIQHAYEKGLPYGASEKETLHPDFFLKDYLGKGKHVYIEHWGYNENNIQYTKTKKFKMPIYENLGITLICTYEKSDSGKIDTVLERKLNKQFIKENQINYRED